MKVLREIGVRKSVRFVAGELVGALLRCCVFPQLRTRLLRCMGATIGSNCTVYGFTTVNFYRNGFRAVTMGADCFIGQECLLDLAGGIRLGARVTLAQRVSVITHMNVGFPDHPLQPHFPVETKPVTVGEGSFVGAGSILLSGTAIGRESFVAAGSIVRGVFPDRVLIGGVPARVIRAIDRTAPGEVRG